MTRNGIDYAWGRPAPSVIRADGYDFCCRYLSYDTSGKNLSRSEADALHAAGIDVVSNWEWYADDALGRAPDGSWINPYQAGVNNARAAAQQHLNCGGPPDRPIYFSVDFDATPEQQTQINSYLDGVASVIGRARTGAYGDFYVLGRAFDAGKITWGWQAYAWSGGQWDGRAQLRQVQNDITVDGVDSDRDIAIADDFGQWGVGDMPLSQADLTAIENIVNRYGNAIEANINARTNQIGNAVEQIVGAHMDAVSAALQTALDPKKTAAAVVAQLPDGSPTEAAVETALRNVLGSLGAKSA